MNDGGVLFMFHCEQDTGYAIGKLENIFLRSALSAEYQECNIYWSYSSVSKPARNVFELPYPSTETSDKLLSILSKNNIKVVLCFDLPFPHNIAKAAKSTGAKIISYWGASMSSINHGFMLSLKKIEWFLRRSGSADLYVFESAAMQKTATHGRGIPQRRTAVIPLGVNINEYMPSDDKSYIHNQLNIPRERKIVFYSGHMEERKGIRTIMKAALKLADENKIENVHFVLCGNKDNEADTYLEELKDSKALSHVSFAGYRDDIPNLMQSSDIGIIASTGWDSFTRSSVEMLASGLPLIVSNLGGLAETTKHNHTGYIFTAGDFALLSELIQKLVSDKKLRKLFSKNARARAVELFTDDIQIIKLSNIISLRAI